MAGLLLKNVYRTLRFGLLPLLVMCTFSVAQHHREIASSGSTGGGGSAPGAPTSLSAVGGSKSASLTWTGSSGATSYIVLRSPSGVSGSFSSIGTPTATNYTDSNLSDGTTYYYEVKASNSYGTSAASNQASALTLPGQPQNFVCNTSSGSPVLTWNAVQSATSYTIFVKANNQTNYIINLATITSPTYTISGGWGDNLYDVEATNATGHGPVTPWLEVNVTMSCPILTAAAGNGLVNLVWSSPNGAASFNLSRSNQYSGPYSVIYSGTATTAIDTNVSNGVQYFYQVVAITSVGSTSPTSNIAAATPEPSPNPLPTPIQVQPVTGSTGGSTGGGGGGSESPVGGGYSTTPLTLPGWAESTIPFDHSAGGGGGPSSTFGVSLPYGVLESDCGPDIAVQNPGGPNPTFERTYRTAFANAGIASDGLPPGWVSNWDCRIYPTVTSGWGNLQLVYPTGGSDTLVPTMAGSSPTGAFTVPAYAPYTVSGTPDPDNPGKWTQIVIHTGATASVTYALEGNTFRPQSCVMEDGEVLNIGYDSSNRFYQVLDVNNNVLLQANYNGSGQLASVSDQTEPLGEARAVNYTYASSTLGATLTTASLVAEGTVTPTTAWQYTYVAVGSASFLSNVATYNGSDLQNSGVTYDANGKVVTLTDADGNTRSYTYGATSTTIATSNASGSFEYWNQSFNTQAQNTGVTNAAGGSSAITYGAAPQTPTSIQQPNENAERFTQIDQYGNVEEYYDAFGCKYEIGYDYSVNPFGRVISVQEYGTDGTARTPTTFEYDSAGHVSKVLTPAAGVIGGATPTSEIDYTYDSKGNLTQISEPNSAGTMVNYSFNYTTDGTYSQAEVLGEPVTVTDPLGNITHYRYDALGNAKSIKDPIGNTTSLTFDDNDLTNLTFANGDQLEPTYTNAGKPPTTVTLTGSAGTIHDSTTFSGEFVGTSVTGVSLSQQAAYNPENLLNSIKNGNGHAVHNFQYNPSGSSPNSQFSNQPFGTSGQKIWTTNYDHSYSAISGTDPLGNTTTITRGRGDNRVTSTTTTGNGNELDSNYSYDTFGRVSSLSDGAGNTLTYTYDDDDNVLSVTTAGTGSGPGYAFNGTTVYYTYFGNGERQSMYFNASLQGSSPATLEYCYLYTYNDGGQLTNVQITTLPANTGYSASGTPTDASATYTYDGDGRVTRMLTPYSDVYYTYDSAGHLTELDNLYPQSAPGVETFTGPGGPGAEPVIIRYYGMSYDISGNRLAESYDFGPNPTGTNYSGSAVFAYSANNEIGSETFGVNGTEVSLNHAYDGAGNLTELRSQTGMQSDATQDAETQVPIVTGTVPAGLLTGTYNLTYDGNGNLNSFSTTTSSFSRTLTYDQANRLSTFSVTGSPSSQSYSYLPSGLRITRPEMSGPVFSYLYDGTAVIGSTLSSVSDGTPEAGLYLWGPTGVAMCYIPDSNNVSSVAYAYDPSGNRVATPGSTSHNGITGCFNIWDAYGDIYTSTYNDATTVTGHDVIDQIAYKGQHGCIDDWDTSLIYCQNRYYATELGRWLTPDPIGLEGGLNVYSFCGNNPLMFSDPSGLQQEPESETDNEAMLDGLIEILESIGKNGERIWRNYRGEGGGDEDDEPIAREPFIRPLSIFDESQAEFRRTIRAELSKFDKHHPFPQLVSGIVEEELKEEGMIDGSKEAVRYRDIVEYTQRVLRTTHTGWHSGRGFLGAGGIRGGYYNNYVFDRYLTLSRSLPDGHTITDTIDIVEKIQEEMVKEILADKAPWMLHKPK